ncbi:MAG: hypothetical protein AB9866_04770 [Syntrophobacteraceae bacterium]
MSAMIGAMSAGAAEAAGQGLGKLSFFKNAAKPAQDAMQFGTQTGVGAVTGGLAAELTGGNFGQGAAQGALTAAYGFGLNYMFHPNGFTEYSYDVSEVDAEIFQKQGDFAVTLTAGGVYQSQWVDGLAGGVSTTYGGASLDWYWGYGRVGSNDSIHEFIFGFSRHTGAGLYFTPEGKFGVALHIGYGKSFLGRSLVNYSGPLLRHDALELVGP